jgi:hypothetical protein
MSQYVGPDGVFPQPEMTQIVQKLGFVGYYYTGDGGSGPQLAFWQGELTSSKVWAFPVASFGKYAALADMSKAHVAASAVEGWLKSVAKYAASQGTIQLVYSHPPDLAAPGYAAAYGAFLTYVVQLQRSGQLVTEPMHVYANFLNRRLRAAMKLQKIKGGFSLTLTDPQGLRQMAIGVPSSWRMAQTAGVSKRNTLGGERSYVITSGAHEVVLHFSARGSTL